MANVLADALAEMKFREFSPMEFYRAVFPEGELDRAGAYTKGKYVGIAVEIEKASESGHAQAKRYSVLDDLNAVRGLLSSPNFCVMAPISYAGKSRKSLYARFMYALVVELDNLLVKKEKDGGLRQSGLYSLLELCGKRIEWIPMPTFLVCSGNGLHLYYVFEYPIPLFPEVVDALSKYKRELTRKIWNRHVTTTYTEDKIQFESIFQAFRMVGTRTKSGDVVRAFDVGNVVSIEELNGFVEKKYQIRPVYKSDLTRSKAKQLYPEWYEKRIVRGEPKGSWICNRAVYDWWKDRITYEATVGHRYYCLMCLVIYAIKCGIPYDELEADCFALMDIFEQRTTSEDNHFTAKDVLDALSCFSHKELFTYPINSIVNRSGIKIEKNKRNGRKRDVHMKYMNVIRRVKIEIGECTGGGRPEKSVQVYEWRQKNPLGRKVDCENETGLSRHTVLKWWDWKPEVKETRKETEDEFWKRYEKTLHEEKEVYVNLKSENRTVRVRLLGNWDKGDPADKTD